jgi:hypothetical protein
MWHTEGAARRGADHLVSIRNGYPFREVECHCESAWQSRWTRDTRSNQRAVKGEKKKL